MTKTEAWLFASRPKTLAGAVAPVVVALALAWRQCAAWEWLPATLCLLFALLMQIDANFINDYYDFKRGRDDGERLGPERACASGWLTPDEMWRGIILTTVMACLAGLPLVIWGGWWLVTIGLLCVAGAFLYTTCLAQKALGDVMVVVFFGLVPVCATYYILAGNVSREAVATGLAVGLATECLLLVNNYRDRSNDAAHNKRTLVVLIGARATEWLYAFCGITASAIIAVVYHHSFASIFLYVLLHLNTLTNIKTIGHGRELNRTLAQTARNILVFALLTTIIILL